MLSILEKIEEKGVVLDSRAGTGMPSGFMLEERKDLNFVLLDLSLNMLRKVPSTWLKVVGRAEKLPFKNHAFDFIICGLSFHHFWNHEKAFEEIGTVTELGGKLYIFEINPEAILGKITSFLERLPETRVSFISPKNNVKAGRKNGFSVHIKGYGFTYALLVRSENHRGCKDNSNQPDYKRVNPELIWEHSDFSL